MCHLHSEFPSTLESLNELMLDEKLLLAVSKLLGTTDIFMTQGDAWLKHGVADDPETRSVFASTDQRLHMDFPNHALTAPGDWYAPDAVAVILYLDDARQCDGRTAVVARRGKDDSAYRRPYRMPGVGTLPWINDRASAEAYLEEKDAQLHAERQAMYAREESVDYRIGTALLYRHDVWHRGTPVRIGASRCVVNLVFKRTTASWLNAWSTGTARFMYGIAEVLNDKNIPPTVGAIEIFFCSLSPRQRSVLGFPAPEDEYWTPVALEELEARWGSIGMDTTPYHRAAARADHRQLKIDKLQAQIDRLRAAL